MQSLYEQANPPGRDALSSLLDQLTPCPDAQDTPVVVLGAGISGLVAAYELGQRGYQVEVIEATGRVGGRIYTHVYQGAHAELGAMRIPRVHQLTHYYCEHVLNLAMGPFANHSVNARLHMRGETLRMDDVAAVAKLYELSTAETIKVKVAGLMALLGEQMQAMDAPLTEADRLDILLSRIAGASEAVQQLDNTSIRDYLFQTVSANAREFIANVNYLKDIWSAPCTALLKEYYANRGVGVEQIQQGMHALPNGLYHLIREQLAAQVRFHFNQPVQRITVHGGRIEVQTPAATDVYHKGLCTLPFPVLRQMQLQGFSDAKLAAIDRYRYAASTKVVLNFTQRFWERPDCAIYGGANVTDEIASQVFYPTRRPLTLGDSDNAWGIVLPGAGAPSLADPNPDPDGPGVVIGSYSWGENARRLGAMAPAERHQRVLACVKQLHPECEDFDELFDGAASMAWEQHPYSGGAFLQPACRDLQVFQTGAEQAEGTLQFSGDHLSSEPGWIQGSIASTWRALAAVTA